MMPFDKLAYEKFYNKNGERYGHVNTRPGIRLHYNDYVRSNSQKRNALKLINILDLDDTCKCIIIGAGFNWTGEGLMEQGIETVGTEISEWILAEKDNTEEADLREYISKTGLNPDFDEIIGDPKDSRCKLYVPEYKQIGFDKWINGPEAEDRRKLISWWENFTETEKSLHRRNMNQNSYNPIMPTAPKPEYMINPLECFLKGGRTAPQPRTSVLVVGEALDTHESRNTVKRLLNDSPTHIISEQVLNTIKDEEVLILCENLTKLSAINNAQVCHILTCYMEFIVEKNIDIDIEIDVDDKDAIYNIQDKNLNWKTYKDWRLFLNVNGFENHKIITGTSYFEYKAFEEVL